MWWVARDTVVNSNTVWLLWVVEEVCIQEHVCMSAYGLGYLVQITSTDVCDLILSATRHFTFSTNFLHYLTLGCYTDTMSPNLNHPTITCSPMLGTRTASNTDYCVYWTHLTVEKQPYSNQCRGHCSRPDARWSLKEVQSSHVESRPMPWWPMTRSRIWYSWARITSCHITLLRKSVQTKRLKQHNRTSCKSWRIRDRHYKVFG